MALIPVNKFVLKQMTCYVIKGYTPQDLSSHKCVVYMLYFVIL